MAISGGRGDAHGPPLAGQAAARAARPAPPASEGDRQWAGRAAGLLMSLAAVTLGVASYLHRDGHIPLGFTVINGERFHGASIPEAVIAFVVAVGGIAALAVPRRARPVALGTTTFAILGVAYGLSVTAGTGRVIDIAYHSALLAVLLATGVVLWWWGGRQRRR
jgi:hypothetical protein